MRYQPFVPDNIKHWKIFKDKPKIKRFMESIEEFLASYINLDEDTCEKIDISQLQDSIVS